MAGCPAKPVPLTALAHVQAEMEHQVIRSWKCDRATHHNQTPGVSSLLLNVSAEANLLSTRDGHFAAIIPIEAR
jgi:hypothetical protein